MWPPAGATGIFFFSLMHPIGPELPISACGLRTGVCQQLYVLRPSHALVQATVGVGTVILVCIMVKNGEQYHFGALWESGPSVAICNGTDLDDEQTPWGTVLSLFAHN